MRMPKPSRKPADPSQAPGPGRSTSTGAFNELRREVAQRNERAHQEARKLRTAREREQLLKRREWDL
jgi:hypothetical protein